MTPRDIVPHQRIIAAHSDNSGVVIRDRKLAGFRQLSTELVQGIVTPGNSGQKSAKISSTLSVRKELAVLFTFVPDSAIPSVCPLRFLVNAAYIFVFHYSSQMNSS
jgi:hypothetical protein